MKHKILKFLTFVTVLAISTGLLSGCKSAVNKLKDMFFKDDDNTAQAPTEVPATEDPIDSIPFQNTPEISIDYSAVSSEGLAGIEKEASDIIDKSIAAAIAYVNTMKDSRHSSVTYSYDPAVNGYLSDDGERALFDKIVSKAYDGETFTVDAKETDVSLKSLFFHIGESFLLGSDPFISSFLELQVKTAISFDYEETVYYSLWSFFFDPYKDANVPVTDKQQILHDMNLLKAVLKRIVDYMPEGLTAYDKYYYLAAVLSEQVSYDDRPSSCYTAFGALIQGKAVCEGYSLAYLLMCREAGLWCSLRSGQPDGVGHGWNMIKLESGIYNVDVTWCDTAAPSERAWYKCFVKTDDSFDDHIITGGISSTGTFEPSPYQNGY